MEGSPDNAQRQQQNAEADQNLDTLAEVHGRLVRAARNNSVPGVLHAANEGLIGARREIEAAIAWKVFRADLRSFI